MGFRVSLLIDNEKARHEVGRGERRNLVDKITVNSHSGAFQLNLYAKSRVLYFIAHC